MTSNDGNPTGGGARATCPQCRHTFDPTGGDASLPVDESVRVWMTEQPWQEPEPTRALYATYLVEFQDRAVSRDRFVAQLEHLGVVEVTGADGRRVLVCP